MSDITTPVGVLQYPALFNAKPQTEGGEPVYSLCMIFDDPEQLAELEKAARAAAVEKFGDRAKEMVKSPGFRWPLRDGAEKASKPGFGPGTKFFNAKTKFKPPVIDKMHNDILDSGEVYAGCLGRASIRFFGYDQKGNRGVGVSLNAFQKVADGERLGGFDAKAAFGEAPKTDPDDMWD